MSSDKVKNCHGCQAELPIGEKRCPYCKQRQQTRLELAFNRGVRALFPKHLPATKLLLISMVIYFIIISIDIIMHPTFGLKEALLSPPGDLIYRWGAHLRGDLVWWRLITANFVHIGILHIVFNMYALRYVSPYVERSYGPALTFSSFVVLGAASMLCSNVLGSGGVVAGASGGLMGFIGLAAVTAHREHTALSLEVRNSMLKWAALTMVIGIVISASGSMGIDNIAHASGFIAGALLGFVLPPQSTTGYTRLWVIRAIRLAFLATLLVVAVSFFLMGSASASGKYQRECISNIKHKLFKQAEANCEMAYRADKSQMISYHNYILISIINGHREQAQSLCSEGRERFERKVAKGDEKLSFDELCRSIER